MRLALVHGKKLTPSGNLHPEFTARLNCALRLFHQGKVNRVIISGGRTRRQFPPESQVGTQYLLEKGIPRSQILTFKNTFTTIDDVHQFQTFLSQNPSVSEVYVITSSWPLLRIKLIYRKLLLSSLPLQFLPTATTDCLFYLFTEPFAILYTLLYSPHAILRNRPLNWFKKKFRHAP